MNETLAPANILIIAVTAYFSYRGFVNPAFLNRYLFSTREILQDRQYYRILTSGLLHADWVHLLFNMFSLYSFGSAVELSFGRIIFLSIYLAGIIGGNILALILHRKEHYLALGASGGVCGVIFACIFLIPGTSVGMLFIKVSIPANVYVVLFMLFSYFGVRTRFGNIGHDAHLGGAVIGLLTATAFNPWIVPENPVLYPAVIVLAIALMILLYRTSPR